MATTLHDARRLALALPEVVEGVCFGTPTFYLRGKLMLRLREDLETLVVKLPLEQRETLLESDPDIFSLTEHYRNYPAILVSLPNIGLARLAEMIDGAWKVVASRKQHAARAALDTRPAMAAPDKP